MTDAPPGAPALSPRRDHGGGLDAAVAAHGGRREDWLDLSTGINPVPFPLPPIPADAWTALPDRAAEAALVAAARAFWRVPEEAEVVASPGLSSLIALLPRLLGARQAWIPGPTYNEWGASFRAAGARVEDRLPAGGHAPDGPVVLVHPNNPDGRLWGLRAMRGQPLTLIDESFCDPAPLASNVGLATDPRVVVLKSFGKFWGLAGLRLGFAILARGPRADQLREALGPWPVSGPALAVGTAALADEAWAEATRGRLAADGRRLRGLMAAHGARLTGLTDLFQLYEVDDALAWRDRLAARRVLVRVFPFSRTWLRLGLPAPGRWGQLEAALEAP